MDYLVLGILATIVILSIKKMRKKKGGCHSNCSGCDKDCANCSTNLLKEYRQNEK